jgi:hypothetical protein
MVQAALAEEAHQIMVTIPPLVAVRVVMRVLEARAALRVLMGKLVLAVLEVVAQGLAVEIKALAAAVLAYLVKAQAVLVVFIKAVAAVEVVVERLAQALVKAATMAADQANKVQGKVLCVLFGVTTVHSLLLTPVTCDHVGLG